jgi:hypothetical protein
MLDDFEQCPLDSLVRITLCYIEEGMRYYQVTDSKISKSTITFIQSEYFKKIPIWGKFNELLKSEKYNNSHPEAEKNGYGAGAITLYNR